MATLKRKQQKIKNLTVQLKTENTAAAKLKKEIDALKAKAATVKKNPATGKSASASSSKSKGGKKSGSKGTTAKTSQAGKTTKKRPARKSTRKTKDSNFTIS